MKGRPLAFSLRNVYCGPTTKLCWVALARWDEAVIAVHLGNERNVIVEIELAGDEEPVHVNTVPVVAVLTAHWCCYLSASLRNVP
jgi:hypothetical protein